MPEQKQKKGFFKILSELILYVVMFVLLISFGLSLFSSLGNKLRYQTYLIQSGSMEPTIGTGAVVLVKKNVPYQLNDVVTYYDHDDRIVTHRLVKEANDNGQRAYITKGDANQSADPHPVPVSDFIGKVVFDFPKIGYLVRFSQTRWGIIALVITPAVIIIYEELLKIGQEVKVDK